MKKVLLALAALVVLYAVFYVGADRWGAGKLAGYEPAWKARIATLREEDARRRMPVLHGVAREENAAPLEKALLERVRALPVAPDALVGVAARSPFALPNAEEPAAVAAHRADIDALAAAVACARCDAENPYEMGVDMPVPALFDALTLGNLAIASGHERARAGDLRGAADRYLDVARLGADVGRGSVIHAAVGVQLEHLALRALGALVADAPTGAAAPLAEIDAALAALEPALPDPAGAFRAERLFAGSLAALVERRGLVHAMQTMATVGGPGPSGLLAVALPGRAVMAHAYPTLDDLTERTEKAAAIEEREARQRAVSGITADARASRNPIVSVALLDMSVAVERLRAPRARLAAVRLAVAVERRRAEEGKAPASLEEKELPLDPCAAPARLRYEARDAGRGYRIRSVGANGTDDSGSADGGDDIVVERQAPAGPR